jgi:hypothetical protein
MKPLPIKPIRNAAIGALSFMEASAYSMIPNS